MAQSKGLQIQSLQHRGLSPQGKPLFTDIAFNVINPNVPTILHLSGCHGVEGYIGSKSQSQILQELDLEEIKNLNVIFVHSINPWGMSWYRRVNGQNIDLNRNYYPDGTDRPENLEFDHFAPLFEKRPPMKKWKIWQQVLKTVFRLGLKKSINVISSGQHHLPDSLFYGGDHVQVEIAELLRVLKSKLQESRALYVIDVHSGLGKFGSENWILDGAHSDLEERFWNETYGDVLNPNINSKYYKAEGTLSLAFRDAFKDRQIYYIFEEFGTRSMMKIFTTLMREHKAFLKLKLDRMRAYWMISAFYPYQNDWREKVSAQAQSSFMKLVTAVKNK